MKILFLNLPYKFQLSRASRWPERQRAELYIIRTGSAMLPEFVKKKGMRLS